MLITCELLAIWVEIAKLKSIGLKEDQWNASKNGDLKTRANASGNFLLIDIHNFRSTITFIDGAYSSINELQPPPNAHAQQRRSPQLKHNGRTFPQFVRAVFAYSRQSERELSLNPGDIIEVSEVMDLAHGEGI